MPTNLYGPNDNFTDMNSHVIPGLIFKMHKQNKASKTNLKFGELEALLEEFMHVDDLF